MNFLNVLLFTLCTTTHAQLPGDYQLKTAIEKQNILFQNVSQRPYSQNEILSHKNPDALSMLKLFSTTYLAKSFTYANDEFETKKTKLIHTYGSVAKVSFKITHKTKYTGLFESGAPGIIRLSLAKLGDPFTPGLALKLLVDNKKSQNIFAMYSLEGQGQNYNFFANSFETKISDPTSSALQILGTRFKLTLVELGSDHQDPTLQSTTDLAKVTTDGQSITRSDAPFSLVFVPTQAAQMNREKGQLRLRLSSAQYSPGMVLYKVFVRDTDQGEMEELGEVVLESNFVASEYGDTLLYFQHNID